MQLVLPSEQYKDSFIRAVKEYQEEMLDHVPNIKNAYDLDLHKLEISFDNYVKQVCAQASGENLPEGFVPQTIYWLVDNNDFIGRVSIRHKLNESLLKEGGHIGYDICPSKRKMGYGKKILELALPKAKEIGITKALVTCNETNIGSKKIIEANGGVLENRIDMGEGKPAKLRYWIELS